MSAVHETAYPQFKSEVTDKELTEIYTPTPSELRFARQKTKTHTERLLLLIHLKTCQRLGYFVSVSDIPKPIFSHITQKVGLKNIKKVDLIALEKTGARHRLRQTIRKKLKIKAFDEKAAEVMVSSADYAAETLQELSDIVNVVIEQLVKESIELPGFTTLLRSARYARNQANTTIFKALTDQLTPDTKAELSQLLESQESEPNTDWHKLKREPKKPTNKEVHVFLEHLNWLRAWSERLPNVGFIPAAKWRQYILEARAMDAADLKKMKPVKRFALMVILIHSQLRRAIDDTVVILRRKILSLHNNAKSKLEQYHLNRTKKTDALIGRFHDVLTAFNTGNDDAERIQGISDVIGDNAETLADECDQHLANADDNYIPFMVNPYNNQRPLLLNCLEILNVQSSSNDQSIIKACQFALGHRHSRKAEIKISEPLSLDWLSEKWYRLVTGKSRKAKDKAVTEVNRKYFELCVLSQVVKELKNGDLYVVNSEDYNDYRVQLIGWEQYEQEFEEYCQLLGLPNDADQFVEQQNQELTELAMLVDNRFPENEHIDFEDGQLVIHKHDKPPETAEQKKLNKKVTARLPDKNIIDVLIETEGWLNLHKKFGPITGFDGKIAEPRKRFVSTLFCYGCNIGPVETARSVKELSRKQVSWLNLHHISEERLDKAIETVVNAYSKFRHGSFTPVLGSNWRINAHPFLSVKAAS